MKTKSLFISVLVVLVVSFVVWQSTTRYPISSYTFGYVTFDDLNENKAFSRVYGAGTGHRTAVDKCKNQALQWKNPRQNELLSFCKDLEISLKLHQAETERQYFDSLHHELANQRDK